MIIYVIDVDISAFLVDVHNVFNDFRIILFPLTFSCCGASSFPILPLLQS